MMFLRGSIATWILLATSVVATWASDVAVEKSEQGATVKIDGKLFTEYLTKSGNKPILWPLMIGDKAVTRGFPIAPLPGESNDHIHQRGMWFDHGHVNGVSFWNQLDGAGEIVHREFLKLEGGPIGVITARNDWIAPGDKKVCSDVRTFRFSADGDSRIIDAEIIVKADDGEVHFADNKEGSFGVRLAETMRVDGKQGGKIITSEGLINAAAWGKPARWVDYQGPVGGETLGVAILDHPKNLGYPTRWHVRDYGLFALNPFTQRAFDPTQPPRETKLAKGDSFTLRYRVILHHGDEQNAGIEKRSAEFARKE